jgi:phosphoenolpyruvate phosphomutase
MATLRSGLAAGGLMRVAGVHDGLSAMLAERHGFDALWASGLGISTCHGVPDTSILTMTELLAAAVVMHQSTRLPVIADCDSGFGGIDNTIRMVQCYERAGVSGVCIEDKPFPKRNSFLDRQELADPVEFAARVAAAKDAQSHPDFIVIARVEALVAGATMDEALERARAYAGAGADAILIHSKIETPREVLDFSARWEADGGGVPLVVVPTTYASIDTPTLEAAGIGVVIYANQALRAAIRAIDEILGEIARSVSAEAVEGRVSTLQEVFDLVVVDDAMQPASVGGAGLAIDPSGLPAPTP